MPKEQLSEELHEYIKTNCTAETLKAVRRLCARLKIIDKRINKVEIEKGYLFIELCNGTIIKCNAFGDFTDLTNNPINHQEEVKLLFGIKRKDKLAREWGLN